MSKMLTETQVLKKLNIPDFRHLSKDNVMSFVSMIDKMDPEVVKKSVRAVPGLCEGVHSRIKRSEGYRFKGNG